MATMTEVRTTVESGLKEQAEAIFSRDGLTWNEAVSLLLEHTVQEDALPSPSYTPGPITQAAILAARRGELVTVGSAEELMADLHADD